MRKDFLCSLMVALLATVFVANQATASGPSGPKFQHAVQVDGQFVGVDNMGQLLSKNLRWGSERKYGSFDRELLPHIDVATDRACVLTKTEILEVSLKTGKILRTQKHDLEICEIGIIDSDKVFLNSGTHVAIVDLNSGETLHRIDLNGTAKTSKKLLTTRQITHSRVENLLYVARPLTKGVAVIDLEKGKLVKEIVPDVRGWVQNVHANKSTVFIRQASMSYGILTENLILVDLKTNKETNVSLGADRFSLGWDGKPVPTEMVGSKDGGVILAVRTGIQRFDASGKLVSKIEGVKDAKIKKEHPPTLIGGKSPSHVWISDRFGLRAISMTMNK
jgi:hypothetical protein